MLRSQRAIALRAAVATVLLFAVCGALAAAVDMTSTSKSMDMSTSQGEKPFIQESARSNRDAKAAKQPQTFSQRAISALARQTNKAITNIMNSIGPYSKLASNMLWRDGLRHCEARGKRLCTLREYCPNGPGTRPRGGTLTGPAWAPVSDGNNRWVWIGTDQNRICKTHTELYQHTPSWGRKPVDMTAKGSVLCCDMEMAQMRRGGKLYTQPTWDEAVGYCSSRNGQRICNRQEYCKDGTGNAPVGGVLSQARWAPVYDNENEWVALGMDFPSRLLCRAHTDISGRRPSWGDDKGSGPERGVVMCCPDDFQNVPGKLTWSNAHVFCYERKMRLCSRDEYCPEGRGHAPRGGERPGEAWAPVSDGENEWISVGFTNPERLCRTHSEVLKGPPLWGQTTGWRGHIQCCSGPPPGLDKGDQDMDKAMLQEQAAKDREATAKRIEEMAHKKLAEENQKKQNASEPVESSDSGLVDPEAVAAEMRKMAAEAALKAAKKAAEEAQKHGSKRAMEVSQKGEQSQKAFEKAQKDAAAAAEKEADRLARTPILPRTSVWTTLPKAGDSPPHRDVMTDPNMRVDVYEVKKAPENANGVPVDLVPKNPDQDSNYLLDAQVDATAGIPNQGKPYSNSHQ